MNICSYVLCNPYHPGILSTPACSSANATIAAAASCTTWDVLGRVGAKPDVHRLPHEVGLKLLREPFVPKDGLRLSLGRLEPEWEDYL